MSNTDREERVRQISERYDKWEETGDLPLWSDIDYLLSLLDSQAAGDNYADRAANLALRICDRRSVRSLDDTIPWASERIAGLANDAATRMRDLCIAKVRERLVGVIAKAEYAHYTELADLNPRRAALEEVKADLESLTLEQEQEKR